jgi:hypothetical protein
MQEDPTFAHLGELVSVAARDETLHNDPFSASILLQDDAQRARENHIHDFAGLTQFPA